MVPPQRRAAPWPPTEGFAMPRAHTRRPPRRTRAPSPPSGPSPSASPSAVQRALSPTTCCSRRVAARRLIGAWRAHAAALCAADRFRRGVRPRPAHRAADAGLGALPRGVGRRGYGAGGLAFSAAAPGCYWHRRRGRLRPRRLGAADRRQAARARHGAPRPARHQRHFVPDAGPCAQRLRRQGLQGGGGRQPVQHQCVPRIRSRAAWIAARADACARG